MQYAKVGWSLPAADGIRRVYDSSRAVEALGWRPRVTFDRLVAALAGAPREMTHTFRISHYSL